MSYLRSNYDYTLPETQIAQEPAEPRSSSKMMVINRQQKSIQHQHFYDFPQMIPSNSLLVVNNTKVIPARILGNRKTGGQLEVLLIEEVELHVWKCKIKNIKKLKIGETIDLCNHNLQATLQGVNEDGTACLKFPSKQDLFSTLEQHAHAPIPPYIHKVRKEKNYKEKDLENYQTTFAKQYGAIAAPTAGLHFTPEITQQIRDREIDIAEVTLHVGLGTFEPVRELDVRKHQIHSERSIITPEVAQKINEAKAQGKKIIALGTTTVRSLESSFQDGEVQAGEQNTNIFIYPPYQFQVVDQLLTNFHLPQSTLLMLVSAFSERNFILQTYRTAVEQNYRFFSYGDCMLIQ